MSERFDFADDFDPEFHTEEEIAAHDEDWLSELEWLYEHDPVFRACVDELNAMTGNMRAQQRGLKQLQHDDPVGLVFFGDDDQWIDKMLSRDTPR